MSCKNNIGRFVGLMFTNTCYSHSLKLTIQKEMTLQKESIELANLTGLNSEECTDVITKSKCSYDNLKCFVMDTSRLPDQHEQKFLDRYGFSIWKSTYQEDKKRKGLNNKRNKTASDYQPYNPFDK